MVRGSAGVKPFPVVHEALAGVRADSGTPAGSSASRSKIVNRFSAVGTAGVVYCAGGKRKATAFQGSIGQAGRLRPELVLKPRSRKLPISQHGIGRAVPDHAVRGSRSDLFTRWALDRVYVLQVRAERDLRATVSGTR